MDRAGTHETSNNNLHENVFFSVGVFSVFGIHHFFLLGTNTHIAGDIITVSTWPSPHLLPSWLSLPVSTSLLQFQLHMWGYPLLLFDSYFHISKMIYCL